MATISRELKRNSKASKKKWSDGYDPQRAQELMLRRHARGRAHKMERQPELRGEVLRHLAEGWSPEQIAGRLAQGAAGQRIGYESIIAIFIGAVGRSKKRCIVCCLAKKAVAESVGRMAGGRSSPS